MQCRIIKHFTSGDVSEGCLVRDSYLSTHEALKKKTMLDSFHKTTKLDSVHREEETFPKHELCDG